MKDAIGQSLEVNDYVTAVWANAEVELFQIVDMKEDMRFRGNGGRGKRGDTVILKRLFRDYGVSETTQNKPVKKLVEQVTKVTAEAVRDAVIMFKLEN